MILKKIFNYFLGILKDPELFLMTTYVRTLGQKIDRSRFKNVNNSNSVDSIIKNGFFFFKKPIISSFDCNEMIKMYLSSVGVSLESITNGTSQNVRLPGIHSSGQVNCPSAIIARNKELVDCASQFLGLSENKLFVSASIDVSPVVNKDITSNLDGSDGAFRFHRDIDGYRFIKMFIYLVDVKNDDCGHHEYVPGTSLNLPGSIKSRLPKRYTEKEILKLYVGTQVVKQFASKGYCFAEDTTGFHRGSISKENPRFMLSLCYGDREMKRRYGDDYFKI